jgi:hypothetical protein
MPQRPFIENGPDPGNLGELWQVSSLLTPPLALVTPPLFSVFYLPVSQQYRIYGPMIGQA